MPRVSVIIPVFNAAEFVEEAICSVLNQSYQDIEVIAIDDGSSDGSYNILKSIEENDSRVKVYKNESNKGVAYTRNKMIELSESEYIALLDADDVCIPDRLEKQLEFLEKNRDYTAIFGMCIIIDRNGNEINTEEYPKGEFGSGYVQSEMIFHNILSNSTAFFRKEFVENNKIKYKDDMCGVEDYLFWVQCIANGAKLYVSNEDLIKYRVVDSGLTITNKTKNALKRKKCKFYISDRIIEYSNIQLSGIYRETYQIFHYGEAKRIERWFFSFFLGGLARRMIAQYSGEDKGAFIKSMETFVNNNINPICRMLRIVYSYCDL